jgi:ABC-type cobalamin transport system permease subunit
MKRDTLYTILLVLIIGFFTINFIFYKMTNRVLMSGITLGIITGSVLLLKDYYQRKKIK